MSDKIIRFRPSDDLVKVIAARAEGRSLNDQAREDLEEFYRGLAHNQWPTMRQHMLDAWEEFHNVAFDATAATGSRAFVVIGSEQIPIHGHNGLRASVRLMHERGFLDAEQVRRFEDLDDRRFALVVEPEHYVALADTKYFLLAVARLRGEFEKFIPEN
jgi:hypothetical protein